MYVGVEIGGTKLQVGLGDGQGELRHLIRRSVQPSAGGAGILRQIEQLIPVLLDEAGVGSKEVRGLGVGFGGPVDDATRSVLRSHQIEGWAGFPLAKWIEEHFGWPAVLGNDADVAGLAEACLGAGRGMSPVFYITLGSGIGGALVIDGKIYRGSGRGAAEIGHLRGWRPGEPGQAFSWQVLEEVASGWSIERRARTLARNQAHLFVPTPEIESITATAVGQAAADGLEWAQQLLLETWQELAEAICQVVALLGPRRIVIGGGVSLLGETYLFKPLRQLVAERVFTPLAGTFDMVPSALGEAVVVHGALALCQQSLEPDKR